MDHRLGFLRSGLDADVVVWDSHPLTLGATPKQVYIDGIAQLDKPFFNPTKSAALQQVPKVPSFGSEPELHKLARGQPDLLKLIADEKKKDVVFVNVAHALWKDGEGQLVEVHGGENTVAVVVKDGKVICVSERCHEEHDINGLETIDLKKGSLVPGK